MMQDKVVADLSSSCFPSSQQYAQQNCQKVKQYKDEKDTVSEFAVSCDAYPKA